MSLATSPTVPVSARPVAGPSTTYAAAARAAPGGVPAAAAGGVAPHKRSNGASETTPLLQPKPRPSPFENSGSAAAAAIGGTADPLASTFSTGSLGRRGSKPALPGLHKPATTWTELGVLVRASIPLSAGLMLENSLSTINLLVATRLGSGALAVVGNSSLLIMVTGFPLPLALAAAFTTISAPLYSQPESRHHIGHILQRTLLLSLLMTAGVMVFWWNIGPILLALKQPKELVEGMKWYMRAATLVLPALGLVESMKSYLQVQGIMSAPPLILLSLLPFHLGLCIYLVHYTSLGATGAAFATAATLWADGLGLVLYASRTRAHECWEGWSKRALTEWGTILWLAIPGALMFGSELWAFEVIALLAGRLGHIAVAAQAVISTLDNLVAMIPYAISIGIANRVGNLLGFGLRAIKRARRTVRAGFVLEVVFSGLTGLTLLIFRYPIVSLITDDPEVQEVAANAAIFVASYQVFDGLQNVGAACLRAFGRQNVGSVIHFVGYYVFGLPLGAWLGLGPWHWGLSGLWAGAATALACTSFAELMIAFTIDWEDEVDKVMQREIEDSEDEDEEDSEDDWA